MNPAKKALASTKNFVVNHKVALTAVTAVTVTTVLVSKLQKGALTEMTTFLEEKGLLEEYINRV